MAYVIFTDLDGTLLDHHTYDYSPARPALETLQRRGIPLILCSSKTAEEMIPLSREMGLHQPLIVENGGGIYVPHGYFSQETPVELRHFEVIRLGRPLPELEQALESIRRELNLDLKTFGEYTAAELAEEVGLSPEKAQLALQREFDLPFLLRDQSRAHQLERATKRLGLRLSKGGRFFHLTGNNDKGAAALRLMDSYRRAWHAEVESIALGDSENDLDLLRVVDYPVVIPNPHSRAPLRTPIPGLIRAPLPGPAGWNEAVLKLVTQGP